ncbi:hypothetical protein GGR54DRAFT_638480 [Hypoxylon sp. NC1633]|nr:hypothetical protein GGR54DRAFT_638480 [Hypoxylon sp. NC1633]
MDDHTRRRRPNEPPTNAPSSSRYPVHDPNVQGPRSYGASGSERYRPAPINTSPSTTRGIGGTANYSGGYYQEPTAAFSTTMQQNTMPYQSEYGQDTRQAQSFSAYNPSIMYNVPQASAQNPVYDTSQQYPTRQPAALQMMQTDVATPYFPSEPTNAAAASSLQPHAGPSSASTVYQQSPAGQRSMLQSYQSGLAPMSGMAQTSTPDQPMEEQQEYPQTTEMGEAYEEYQAALREVFSNIRNGVLQAASESLLHISEWLLSKAVELGLTADDEDLYKDRFKMWQDFNHAWLSLFQKQKDMMESNVPLQRGQTLINEEGLRKMGKEIVRLCDGIDRHGLVDYEYGVWEEPIIAIIEECLDFYENEEDEGEAAGPSVANPAGTGHRGHHTSR